MKNWASGPMLSAYSDGSDADAAAQQPADREDGYLDRRADDADRVAAGGQPGHQTVARAGSETGTDVEAGGDPVGQDAGGEEGESQNQSCGCGRIDSAALGGESDDDDVADRTESRAAVSAASHSSSTMAPTR